ncbi:hypothetical protein M378DRAFT_174383 [Amanita muscaria Koide BX008]|uniref:Uncharacterized protein n=1 Tax=Amanita muscaria (strain Koide BX008) TaxID=946122 RepID=A0A0C2VZD3_AMAMK|nr:hypothetical protein M378DRAFT_174386 [Amanita muscaria Koide BX008]KIL54212.1 hypothetical protein M378DRAFT_174383 [Amanita muscaria Koide BX008]
MYIALHRYPLGHSAPFLMISIPSEFHLVEAYYRNVNEINAAASTSITSHNFV